MALYRTGTAAMDAQGVITGTGTKWREPLSLIRTGATIVFLTSPLKLAVISDIVSDTEMKAIQTDGEPVENGNYVILLNDSLTVDGMAQDVAETLRYYQSKETVIEEAIEFFKNFDLKTLQDLVARTEASAQKTDADRAATEQLKNDTQTIKDSAVTETQQIKDAAVSETQQIKNSAVAETNQIKADTDAIKNQTQQIKDSAVTEITGIKNEALDARDEAENAKLAAEQSKVGADNAKAGAETARDEARQWAQQLQPENLLYKDQNLADLPDKAASRKHLALDRVSQFPTETLLRAPATATYFTVGGASWGVYDSINATWKPLAVAQGGTGAKTVDEAKINLSVDRIRQDPTVTHLFTQNKRYSVVMDNNGKWGGYDSTDGVYVPLGITEGGTGRGDGIASFKRILIDGTYSQDGFILKATQGGNIFSCYADKNDVIRWRTGMDVASGDYRIYYYDSNGQYGGTPISVAPGGVVTVGGSIMSVRTSNGRTFRMENSSNAEKDGIMQFWGSTTSGRASVFEFKLTDGYVFYAQQNQDGSRKMDVPGNITCYSLTQKSDRDLKSNIKVIENATEAIRKMSGYTYTMKSDGMPYAGVIAQEVMEALPEAVSGVFDYVDLPGPTKDGSPLQGDKRYLGVDYSAVTGLLVQVCRESDDRISKLEGEVADLKAAIAEMQAMFVQLAK